MNQTPPFTHDGTGTDPSAWLDVLTGRDVPDLGAFDHVVVLAAHPDDETLGAGGLMARAFSHGCRVTVVVATDGEASHPESPTRTAASLGAARRHEVDRATRRLAPTRELTLLGLPDGSLSTHARSVVEALVDIIGRGGDRTLLVAPFRHDGHPDHEAAGRAAAVTASRTDALLREYPIWLWHWGDPADWAGLRWESAELRDADRAVKDMAMAEHRTQVEHLSDRAGDEALLGEHVLAHFRGEREWFIDAPLAQDRDLDELHAREPDPWATRTSPYEQAKQEAVLEALGGRHFRRALDLGCSVGTLTAALADRADAVLAVDASAHAVDRARAALVDRSNVQVEQRTLPDDWPVAPFDLVVASEVGYFLSPRAWSRTLDAVAGTVPVGGWFLLCHWLHDVRGWPLDGTLVHDQALRREGWRVVSSRRADDYRIDLLERVAG